MLDTILTFAKDRTALFLAIASAVILAAAYGFQFAGYQPCTLCWYQRYPYMAIIAIVGTATLLKKDQLKPLLILVILLLFVNAAIAGFHVGVELKWWEGLSTCGGAFDISNVELTVDNLYNMAERVVRCDEAAWTLFGISMAGYNMILALVLGGYGLRTLLKGE